MSNTSWFSWWFYAQPAAAETNGVADPTASRCYLAELKQKQRDQLRAERAECRLDFSNESHSEIFHKSIAQATYNLMRSSIECIEAEIASDSVTTIDLRKVLSIRETRRAEDLEQRIKLQTDYMRHQNFKL